MDTSSNGIFIDGIAHSQEGTMPLVDEQIVVYDTRLRNWQLAASGGLVNAAPCRTLLNELGELLRIRTLIDGTLEIVYADPLDTVTWSANTITSDAMYQAGVDLYVQTGTHKVYAFWFVAVVTESIQLTLTTARSLDDGHTWEAAEDIYNLPNQGSVTPQLCAPALHTVVFTDSTVGRDSDNNPLTALYLTLKHTGWITPVLWDLGGQALGVETNVPLPNGTDYPSNLSGLEMGDDTKIEISFYGNQFREGFENGVLVQRVYNLDHSSDSQELQWTSPEEIFESIAVDDNNNSTQIFTAFPRLQRVGNEYWILALECSQYGKHQRYHLAMFRSVDGMAWSDRDYRQGAAIGGNAESHTFAYAYNGSTPFLYTDLIYASLVVTAERTFICGYDKVFYCPSTILVGVDNPQTKLDLTPYVPGYDINLPTAPTAGTASYTLGSVPKTWGYNDILSAEHGVIIKHFAGYYDEDLDEDRLIQVGTYHVDNLTQHTAEGQENGAVDGIDNTMLLDRWKGDKAWEWQGSSQMSFEQFCDLSGFIVVDGSYTTGYGGRMRAGVVTTNDNFPDDVAVLNLTRTDGGILTCEFRCDRNWEHIHKGIAFQGKAGENKVFWAVLYNRKNSQTFTLNQAIPRSSGNVNKLYKYKAAVQESATVVLDIDTNYFMKVAVYHGHVLAWYSLDGISWINVIDYTSPASPVADVLPCRLEWWGLIGTQRTKPSGPIGNTQSNNSMQDLFVGTAPRMVALHVALDNVPSILRRVAIGVTQENTGTNPMPDLNVMLVSGDSFSPNDATDEDNVIFSYDASALFYGAHDSPQWSGANDKPNPQRTRLDASQDVWITITPDADLAAGQTYKWASDVSGNYGANQTKYSDDGGATWNNFGDANLNMTAAIEVEYLDGRIKFYDMSFASARRPYTIERMVHQIAAKAGVLEIEPDSFLEQSDLTLESDGIYWQPQSFGRIADMSLEADVVIDTKAVVIWGSSAVGDGKLNGWRVQFERSSGKIAFYAPDNTLLTRTESLQPIPETCHIEVDKHGYFLYAYVNECLASVCYDVNIFTRIGYLGIDSDGITSVDNLRVPDMTGFTDYWLVSQKENALQAIENLISKPAAGTIARGNFYITAEGKLRISSFLRRTLSGTYQDYQFDMDKEQSARYALSQVVAVGNYYMVRWQAEELDKHGRWYDERDVTDAPSDHDAYRASKLQFRDAQEKELTHGLNGLANFAQNREDLVQLINPLDGSAGYVIVNDINFTLNKAKSEQRLGFRTYTIDREVQN